MTRNSRAMDERPLRGYIDVGTVEDFDDGAAEQIDVDGASVALFRSGERFYGRLPLEGSLEDALDYAVERLGQPAPVSELIRRDFWELVSPEIQSASVVGEASIENHDLGLRQKVVSTVAGHPYSRT